MALSGNLNQMQRNTIMSQFERAVFKILVTTDVASRGLDIANVTHVINFDMPKHTEEYVHRVGRTGRAGNKGDAVSLVGPKDWDSFKRVEAYLKQDIKFDVLDGLEGKFKGLKVRQPVNKAKAQSSKAKPQAKKVAKKPLNAIKVSTTTWPWVIPSSFRRRKWRRKSTTSNTDKEKPPVGGFLCLLNGGNVLHAEVV